MENYSNVGSALIKAGITVADKYDKISKAVGAEYQLSVCEMGILHCLYMSSKPHTVRYVSNNTHYSKGMISRCVESLNQNGYVTVVRDEIDRRAVRISLTEKSEKPIRSLCEKMQEFSANVYSEISESELDEFNRILVLVTKKVEDM